MQAQEGTLGLLLAVLSAPEDVMTAAMEAVAAHRAAGGVGVLGLHLEGPYIDQARAGVHDRRYIRRGSTGEVRRLLASPAADTIRLLTASPSALEPDGAELLQARGVKLAIGHSEATYDEAFAALERSFSAVTHLFNAMSPFQGRAPGVVGAAFAHPEAWASVIADGFHVHPGALLAAKRVKGERLLLVSDSMPPVGVASVSSGSAAAAPADQAATGPAPAHEGATAVASAPRPAAAMDQAAGAFRLGPKTVTWVSGRCTTSDGTLAGSGLSMVAGVRFLVESCGIPLAEALRMASTYPARFLGLEGEAGVIQAGSLADLVVFDAGPLILGTVRRGTVWL